MADEDEALQHLEAGGSLYLQGLAGTGKTHFIGASGLEDARGGREHRRRDLRQPQAPLRLREERARSAPHRG